MKVDFMIVGAQKCGTTTLFDILNNHPAMSGCTEKEPHYFSTVNDWESGLKEYHDRFDQKDGVLYFEASTTYTFYPIRNLRIWHNLFDYNPNMKFIYVVRKPIDRIISSYMHTYERGYTDLGIEKALVEDRTFMDLTRYYTQIAPYIRKFGRDKVLIIDFDDFIGQRETVMEEVAEFLGVDVTQFSDYQKVNSNVSIGGNKTHYKFDSPSRPLRLVKRYLPPLWRRMTDNSSRGFSKKPVLNAELQEMINNMLELEIRELGRLMNKDLGKWIQVDK